MTHIFWYERRRRTNDNKLQSSWDIGCMRNRVAFWWKLSKCLLHRHIDNNQIFDIVIYQSLFYILFTNHTLNIRRFVRGQY